MIGLSHTSIMIANIFRLNQCLNFCSITVFEDPRILAPTRIADVIIKMYEVQNTKKNNKLANQSKRQHQAYIQDFRVVQSGWPNRMDVDIILQ